MGEAWTVNDERKKAAYIAHVNELFAEHKYLTFPAPRIGADRSLDQNALFHVWLTEFCCHLARCHKSQVTEGMLEGIKLTMKGLFYRETDFSWMLLSVECPLTGNTKRGFTSSKTWRRGEMFLFLDWLQNFAATKGCILESKGEFAKLKRDQNK